MSVERCGAVVKHRTRDREVPGSIPTNSKCCFLEQETLSTLLSTGSYPGKKRATWKISTRLLNMLPSINKVDYYYYYYYYCISLVQFQPLAKETMYTQAFFTALRNFTKGNNSKRFGPSHYLFLCRYFLVIPVYLHKLINVHGCIFKILGKRVLTRLTFRVFIM